MKRYLVIGLSVVMMFLVSCSKDSTTSQNTPVTKPVKVMETKVEAGSSILDYTGVIKADEMKKVGFKSPGKIAGIAVKKGQMISKGDELVRLDTKDLEFSVSAARAQTEALKAQYEKAVKGPVSEEISRAEQTLKKAEDAYSFSVDNFSKLEKLYAQGALSKLELDKAKLELDVRLSDLNIAKESLVQIRNGSRPEDIRAVENQLKQSQADFSYKSSMLEDAVLRSDMNGYVVDVLYKEGEFVPSGYPVVVLRNGKQVASVGLTQKHTEQVKPGTRATVSNGQTKTNAVVTTVDHVPDAATRTYNAELSLENNNFDIGSVVYVSFILGEESSTWIPTTAVIAGKNDYVYVADTRNQAVRREVEIIETRGAKVKVKGLQVGDRIVVEGMRRLIEGDAVEIKSVVE